MKKTVLLTGIAGFIGSHLATSLCERNCKVIGIDNFDDYYDPSIKRSNIKAITSLCNSDLTFLEGDIRDYKFIAELFKNYDFDAIFHLAAMPGVRASIERPTLYYDVNLKGTLNILEAIAKHPKKKLPKFIFASTSSVYGNTSRIPFKEDDPCSTPLAPYPATKRSAELLGYTYYHLYKIPFMAIRFFTVFGPRNRPDMMIYKLAESLFLGKEVFLYNSGYMYRDWTYVKDIVEGVLASLEVEFGYEIVNLGRGEPVLLLDFVRIMEALTGRKANLLISPKPPSDMEKTFASIEKASKLLGYKPKTSIEEGIKQFLAWYISKS